MIRGQVTDSNGAVIPGATVRAIRAETSDERTATTSAQGEFLFAMLPPGAWDIEITAKDFKKTVVKLELRVNQELRADTALQVSAPEETVTIDAPSVQIKRDSGAIGTVIDNQQITGLPLDGRNYLDLSLLVTGAVPAAPGSAGSARGDFAFNVNGAREDANNFLLDGVYNVDPKLNTFGVRPPVDAVREFEVITNGYDASFGRNAGAQVNVVLKTGTNDWHGSGWEFFRNGALDARNFFAPASEPAPEYNRNQFGLAIGGPICRNRAFFFADYEGLRARQGITRITNVPTQAERNGDFSQSFLPGPLSPLDGQPIPGGRIPSFFLNPIGVKIAALYPLPNRNAPFQNYVSSPIQRDRNDHFDARVDYNATSAVTIFSRYSFGDRDLYEPFSGASFAAIPGYGTNIPRRGQNALVGSTQTFSSSLLNDVRFAWNRVAAGAFHENIGRSVNRQVGLPEVSANARDHGLSYITIIGFS
ncbi:MAG: carboxypeptidase regulatory-like domain-containing protein, partial [Blastocatellia bacterium]